MVDHKELHSELEDGILSTVQRDEIINQGKVRLYPFHLIDLS